MGVCSSKRDRISTAGDLATHACCRDLCAGRYHRLPNKLQDDYVVHAKVLGTGMSGAVHRGISKATGTKVAVKSLGLSLLPAAKEVQDLANEVELLLSVDNPFVVRLLDVYQDLSNIHFVMELLEGGTMTAYVMMRSHLPEPEVTVAASQMLRAVSYMHNRGLVHRDIKSDNFVYSGPRVGEGMLKMIDFGLSKHFEQDEKLTQKVGTTYFMAPEVLNNSYTSKCDIWSVGVATFFALLGYLPFRVPPSVNHLDNEQPRLERLIRKGEFRVEDDAQWEQLSESARDFIKVLLSSDPQKRPTAEEALQHCWFPSSGSLPVHGVYQPENIANVLALHASSSVFKRACLKLMVWSSAVGVAEQERAAEIFQALDTSKHGAIDFSDFQKACACKTDGLRPECQDLFQKIDSNRDGEVEYSELLAAVLASACCFDQRLLTETFLEIDRSRAGYISVDDLRVVFGDAYEDIPVERLLEEVSAADPGFITYGEFVKHMSHGRAPSNCDASALATGKSDANALP